MSADTLLPKHFDHVSAERRIYKMWEESGIFNAEPDPARPAFCVVIPPPNVTGILHMGHVLDNLPQDVMTRWHRMRGFSAVWIPGTDHAGIATQNVVKRQLDKEGLSLQQLGREAFIERVWQWREKSGSIIIEQLKRLGCSCDWRKERFTMDPDMVRAVLTAFVTYFERGLVYRGKRMVNWCTVCNTALADEEVEHAEHNSYLWYLRYPVVNEDGVEIGEWVTLATTRPETMLGDTGVAVHPADHRYTMLIGKQLKLPLQNRLIPVVADEFVDPKFGTGIVKLTPAHDPNDYTVGVKLDLPLEVVIGLDGRMTVAAGPDYVGLDRFEARKKVVADLEAGGFLVDTVKHRNTVGECYRCKSIVEPMVSDQWFVKMQPLAEKAKAAVLDGRVTIIPDSEKHDYFHWLDTIRDWCISRQLWWGHRVPVYYCDGCGEVHAAVEAPQSCRKCGNIRLRQDEDVLDTWFSSQLWPFATLGWPDLTPQLKYWYPNSWLISGRDILFFWDARMIMAGLELVGDVPFKTLALHGLVRDAQGRKLSKSLGNSADPLELFDRYGADGVRAAIAANYPMGRQDTRLSDELFKNGQSLVIKLWNATRLLLSNIEGGRESKDLTGYTGNTNKIEDRWILALLREVIIRHDAYLTKSDITHAFEAVTKYFWDDFCDWYLEIIKPRLRSGGEDKLEAMATAFRALSTIYQLMHPYIPFVTEELWQVARREGLTELLGASGDAAILAGSQWPDPACFQPADEQRSAVESMISLVRGVRDIRQHLGIGARELLPLQVAFSSQQAEEAFAPATEIAIQMGYIGQISISNEAKPDSGWVPFDFKGGVASIKVPDGVDKVDIVSKLDQRLAKLHKGREGVVAKLNNGDFVSNAPPELVDEARSKVLEFDAAILALSRVRNAL